MKIPQEIRLLLEKELDADAVFEDETTQSCLGPHPLAASARIWAREAGVFSGEWVLEGFRQVFSDRLKMEVCKKEGDFIEEGENLVKLESSAQMLLSIERTLLNFLGHLCGVATTTRKFVEKTEGSSTQILATRKTLPGLRSLQLHAVVAGGGKIHRRSLNDGILIKDNHLRFSKEKNAIQNARKFTSPLHKVEIEVENLNSLKEALKARPDVVMLDNFSLREIQEALALINSQCLVEVSGGVQLDKVEAISKLGVDFISVGSLTHSVKNLDLTMDFDS